MRLPDPGRAVRAFGQLGSDGETLGRNDGPLHADPGGAHRPGDGGLSAPRRHPGADRERRSERATVGHGNREVPAYSYGSPGSSYLGLPEPGWPAGALGELGLDLALVGP